MQTFKNLYDFIEHCEDVILESQEEDKEEFAILAVMANANYMNLERLLNDAKITLNFYYSYLEESVKEELFNFAVLIVQAKNIEIQHYIKLAKTIIPEETDDFKNQIIALDIILNDQYLSND